LNAAAGIGTLPPPEKGKGDLAYRARGQWQDDGSNAKVTISGWLHGPELGVTFKF